MPGCLSLAGPRRRSSRRRRCALTVSILRVAMWCGGLVAMETAGLPYFQGGEQSGVRSRELGNASTANQRAFDGASGRAFARHFVGLEMAHFPAARGAARGTGERGEAIGGSKRRRRGPTWCRGVPPRRRRIPPPPSFRPRPASGCRCGASGAGGGRGNLGTWESGELTLRGGRGRDASFPGFQIPRLRAESGPSTSPNGHKPSFPTRSKILSRTNYEWQVSGEKTDPLFGSTRPTAVRRRVEADRRQRLTRSGKRQLTRGRAFAPDSPKQPFGHQRPRPAPGATRSPASNSLGLKAIARSGGRSRSSSPTGQ
jgi:hypothetical protein